MKEIKPKKKKSIKKKYSREEHGAMLYTEMKTNIMQISEGEYRIESESRKGTFYTVGLPDDPNELGVCTCPDYTFNCIEKKIECKHIAQARALQKDLDENLYGQVTK